MTERKGQEFNFWTALIQTPEVKTHKSCELLSVPEYEIEMRKSSSFEDFNREEMANSCQLIRTPHSSF